MLTRFIEKRLTIERLSASPVARLLDGFAEALFAAGYSRSSAQRYINAAAHLGYWCRDRHLTVAQIHNHAVDQFVAHTKRRCHCPGNPRDRLREARSGVRRFVEFLRERGFAPLDEPASRLPVVVRDFAAWMRGHRGVGEPTMRIYLPLVAEFVLGQATPPDSYDAAAVRTFVFRRSCGRGPDRARAVTTAVRMFLTFLSVSGQCSPTLIGAVPTVAAWRLAKLPRFISADEVEKALASFDVNTPRGARNRAMALLMARLGLRVAEVAALKVCDLDWDRGRVRVTGKGRTQGWLPLPQDVGDAVLHYVGTARPGTCGDHVFARALPPWRPIRPSSISSAMVAAMTAAGIQGRFRSAHVLRHSLAASLLRRGASLEQIGVLLRHRSTAATEIYAKVDLAALQRIAQPWPTDGVPSC